MAKGKEVWLTVKVDVPNDFDPTVLPGFLDKFVDIGISDLQDSCYDENLDMTEEERIVAKAEWGSVHLLESKPLDILKRGQT